MRPIALGGNRRLGDGLALVGFQKGVIAGVGEIRADLNGAFVRVDVEEAVVEGPVVVFAQGEPVAGIVGAAFSAGDDVGRVDDGAAAPGTAGVNTTDAALVSVQLAHANAEGIASLGALSFCRLGGDGLCCARGVDKLAKEIAQLVLNT